jgi:hypothetical protein
MSQKVCLAKAITIWEKSLEAKGKFKVFLQNYI